MKKILVWILCGLSAAGAFLLGFLIRQPKINKLKKHVVLLQQDNSKLLELCQTQHDEFRELLVQHKTLKAFDFEKKATSKGKLKENLVMQYAFKAYIELLLKRIKYEQKLSTTEIIFFNAYETVIDGKMLSNGDMIKIRDYVLEQHTTDIKNMKECQYTEVLMELNNY